MNISDHNCIALTKIGLGSYYDYIDSLPKTQKSGAMGFLKRHVVSRAGYLAAIPCHIFASAIDGIASIGTGFYSIITAGTNKKSLQFAGCQINSFVSLLPDAFYHLQNTICPGTERDSLTSDGILTKYVYQAINAGIQKCNESDNFILKHVISRLTAILLPLACAVTRAVDFFLGIVAALAALLTAGKIKHLNNLAGQGLQINGIALDLFMGVLRFVNPQVTLKNNQEKHVD
jgi:hypothetical protein